MTHQPTSASMLISEAEHQQRLRAARPDIWRQIAAGFALMVGVACVLGAVYRIKLAVDTAAQARESPISYPGKFVPEKPFFRPGEDATFRFVRVAEFEGKELFVQGLGSFENTDTGVSYSTGPTIKALREKDKGRRTGITVRTVPTNVKPGKHYTYEGLVVAQGSYRTLPVGFTSETFEIRQWASEQEHAQYDEQQAARRRADKLPAVSLDAPALLARE